MTLDEINEQIAKLMQEKAEDQALAHYVAPRASSRFDYIINGDRSGLDKFDASEQAYATMLAKQRMANDEAYKQRVFNELSKEADRLNTLKIAEKANKNNPNYLNDIANKYELANTDYELALQTFNPDDPVSVANLKRKAQMLNHYGSQLGIEPVSLDAPTSRPKTGVEEQKDYEGEAQTLLSKKSYTNADRNRIKELIPLVKDVTTKAQLEAKLVDKGPTKEDKDIERFNKLQAILDSDKNLNTRQRTEYNNLKSKLGK